TQPLCDGFVSQAFANQSDDLQLAGCEIGNFRSIGIGLRASLRFEHATSPWQPWRDASRLHPHGLSGWLSEEAAALRAYARPRLHRGKRRENEVPDREHP